MVFNHDQTDYLEETVASGPKWRFDNASINFGNPSNQGGQSVCLSSTSKHLLMFDNADSKCNSIVNSICGSEGCNMEDMLKAPVLSIVLSKYEFGFDGPEYLYPQRNGNGLTFKCRFTEVDPAENCHDGDFILGRGFYMKYVPVFKYSLGSSEDGLSDTVTPSLAWLPAFEDNKDYSALKWVIAGVVMSAIVWKIVFRK